MEPTSSILTIFLKAATDLIKERIQTALSNTGVAEIGVDQNALAFHLQHVSAWSNQMQIYGMTSHIDTEEVTVPLSFDVPRRFRRPDVTSYKSEPDLLQANEHCLLLGNPGAGKTTTLKRLARFLLTQPSTSEVDLYQYPILVRLRDVKESITMSELIANILGIPYWDKSKEEQQSSGQWSTRKELVVGENDVPLSLALVAALEASQAVILADGLDEASNTVRVTLEQELEMLASQLTNTKILVTSRSGGYRRNFEGFTVAELCPLSTNQISTIASAWLGQDTSLFLNNLSFVPYADLADRPLLLVQLLILFKRRGYLPEQPSQVYKQIIQLFLEDWDYQRRISRQSKYASFGSERKREFLSAIAYQLTYKLKRKLFSTDVH